MPLRLKPRVVTLLLAVPGLAVFLVLAVLETQSLLSGAAFSSAYFWLAAPCLVVGLLPLIFLTGTSLRFDGNTLVRTDFYGLRRRSIAKADLAGVHELANPANTRRESHHYAVVDRHGRRFTYLRGMFWRGADIDRLRERIGWASALDDRINFGPHIDPTLGDRQARTLRAAIYQGGLQLVEDSLTQISDPPRREFLFQVLGTFRGRPRWMDEWVQTMPASTNARVAWGVQATTWAWEARPPLRSNAGPEQEWQVFFDRLRLAEEQLNHATVMAPSDSSAWLFLIKTGIGVSKSDRMS